MCRSRSQGGRRCNGSQSRGGGAGRPAVSRRVDGKPEAEADERFFNLRESGYTGPIDGDGHRVDPAPARSAGDSETLASMKSSMREWRSRPVPVASPQPPMSPQMARAMGCDTPEGRAKYDRLRAYREAGYDGPLDSNNNIPDPDDPVGQRSLDMLAALSETGSSQSGGGAHSVPAANAGDRRYRRTAN